MGPVYFSRKSSKEQNFIVKIFFFKIMIFKKDIYDENIFQNTV